MYQDFIMCTTNFIYDVNNGTQTTQILKIVTDFLNHKKSALSVFFFVKYQEK